MLRHERMAVAMAVAEATHHSSRGQKSATVIREVEEHETHAAYGHRRLLHRGRGQASLRSLGRRGVTAACGTPRVSDLSSWWQRWQPLRLMRKEEEERKKKEKVALKEAEEAEEAKREAAGRLERKMSKISRRVLADMPVPIEELAAWEL